MKHIELRDELREYYQDVLPQKYDEYNKKCTEILKNLIPDNISVYKQKGMQYEIIADTCNPVLFRNSHFYYEIGTMDAFCGGVGEFEDKTHPGGWTYRKNVHRFKEQDPELFERSAYAREFPLFYFCGVYADERHHFTFNIEPVLKHGLKKLYENATSALKKASTEEEKDFLENMQKGLLALKKISDKFAICALKRMEETDDEEEKKRLQQIAKSAASSPWCAPESFYEALSAIAFMQTASGTLEGVGIYNMGRLDVLLEPFYIQDIEKGVITKDEAYDLICEFLILWNSHIIRPVNSDEHGHTDLAITYTLGGCDACGKPLCNDLTMMFLKANSEEKIIFPKIKCRYSAASSKEYIDAINKDITKGRTTILYQNDDVMIPALVKKGVSLEDARNYSILGCWELVLNDSTNEHCGYINLLKIFELSVWGDFEKKYGISIKPIEDAESFEEVYSIVISNIKSVLEERCYIAMQGRRMWKSVDSLMILASANDSCIKNRKDINAGGTKYAFDELPCSGFPNIIDSLLVIKELCFDRKVYKLKDLINAVKNNWVGSEDVRNLALKCAYWGDEGEESCSLASRFNDDLCKIADNLPTLWGGKVTLGYTLYMEMTRYAKTMRATPDGRRNYDYFARDLTPTILHNIHSASAVLNSMRHIDTTKLAANSTINVNIPFSKNSVELCDAFVRVAAKTGVQSILLNCVTEEELLDSQIHPENHTDLVVRVCGFSDKFINLTKEVQEEFLKRNFYDCN